MSAKGPRDGMGNELEQGHTVLLKFEPPMLIGTITELKLGGIVLPGKDTKPTGSMKISITYDILFNEGAQIGRLVRVVNPEETKNAIRLADEMKKVLPN